MSKSKITYRFEPPHSGRNGATNPDEDRPSSGKVIPLYHEEFTVVEVQQDPVNDQVSSETNGQHKNIRNHEGLVQFTEDYGEWNSPFDAETRRIERLIREADKPPSTVRSDMEPRPQEPTHYVEVDVDLEEDPPLYEGKQHVDITHPDYREMSKEHIIHLNPDWYHDDVARTRIAKHHRPPWITIIASICGAVATGVLLGFFVLNMFSEGLDGEADLAYSSAGGDLQQVEDGEQPLQSPEPANPQEGTVGSNDARVETPGVGASATVTTIPLQMPERTYSFLQIGVFSTRQSADTMMNDLTREGLAAVMEPVGANFAVYAGVTANRDHALLLSSRFDDKVPEIYAKSVTIPRSDKVNWIGNNADSITPYITAGNNMMDDLIQLSIVHINEARPGQPDEDLLQAIKKEHQSWTSHATQISNGASDIVKPTVQRMNTAMNTAILSLDEYKKSPSVSYLWQIQESILQYLIAEKQLLSAITG